MPAGVLRAIWVALAVMVPVTVGVVLRLQAPPEQQAVSWPRIVARGFPIPGREWTHWLCRLEATGWSGARGHAGIRGKGCAMAETTNRVTPSSSEVSDERAHEEWIPRDSRGSRTEAAHPLVGSDGRPLPTKELLTRILHTASQLISTEILLAREEGKANLEAELATVKWLVVAAVLGFAGVNLLFVAAVFALAHVIPAWLAAVLIGGVILMISIIVAYIGWQRRVTRPLAVTRKTVTEDMQWVKERLA